MTEMKITNKREYRKILDRLERILGSGPGNVNPEEAEQLIRLIEEYESNHAGPSDKVAGENSKA